MTWRLAVLCAAVALSHAYGGELTRRSERTIERVLEGGPPRYTAEFLLADLTAGSERRFAEFSGDLSGRYLGAMALSGPGARAAAIELAPQIFALQREDGGFGRPLSNAGATEDDMARLWGHGRLLVGLVEYHEITGDDTSLAAARRLGDFLTAHAQRFNASEVRRAFEDGSMAHGYICWTQNVEALALLARATGEERYKDAALSIAEGIERRPGQHAHGWLSSMRGLTLLAEEDASLLPQVERAWKSFAESEDLLWTGGPPEYFAPGIARDEGCASADWVRLNLALWKLTANERYLQAAENALFNAFFANQLPNGGFGHLRFSNEGFTNGSVEAWWCCTLHGARAFADIRKAAFREEGGELYYDLPVDGRGEASGLILEADAEPALHGRVTIRVLEAPPTPVVLRVRKPARTLELRSTLGAPQDGGLALERVWKPGEAFDVEYAFSTSVEESSGAKLVKRGPWTLGLSEGADPAYFSEGAENHRIDWQSLGAEDQPSRAAIAYQASFFGGQAAQATLRPISERWESPAHALRWTTRFGEIAREDAEGRAARYAKPAAAGFLAGVLVAGLIAWRLRRRPERR